MEKQFYVYILSSGRHDTFYIGVASDLRKAVQEHKSKTVEGFASSPDATRLVYFEAHANAENAIRRQRRLSFRPREWKIALVEEYNPDWLDLYEDVSVETIEAT